MSEAIRVTHENTERNLSDLRQILQTFGSASGGSNTNFTALDYPIFSFDDNIFPGSPCPTENLILSPQLHEEVTEKKFTEINGTEEFSNFSLDPVLENSVDIQQILNNTVQVNDETLEKLILDVKTSDISTIANVSTPIISTAIPSTVAHLSDIDFMSANNNITTVDLPVGWDALTVKTEDPEASTCSRDSFDSQLQVTSSTITPPPSPGVQYTRGKPGRKPSAGGPIRSKKRQPDKGTEEYFDKRARNNVAVRKSRDKAKQKQKETEDRVQQLVDENETLQKKLDLLSKELNVLKGLFINVGASLPANFEKLLAKWQ